MKFRMSLVGMSVWFVVGAAYAQAGEVPAAPAPSSVPAPSNAPAPNTAAPATEAPASSAPASSAAPAPTQSAPAEATTAAPPPAAPPPAAEPSGAPNESGVTISEIERVEVMDLYGEGGPPPAGAAAPPPPTAQKAEPEPDYTSLPQTYHIKHFDVGLGLRVRSLTSHGLQPYLEDPVGVEAVGRLGATVIERAPWGLSVTLEASGFSRQGTARNTDTRLRVLDMAAGVEGRYLLHHRLAAYARLGVGAERSAMEYGCSSCTVHAQGSNWAFLVTGSLGLAFRLVGSSDGRKRAPRGWLFMEGGGSFATQHDGTLEVEDGPYRPEPIELSSFSTSGGHGTVGLMFTY